MRTDLPFHLAERYKSPAQIARVVTENWVEDNMYCPSCESHLSSMRPGKRVYDFVCACEERYQLKSKSSPFGRRVVDAAYKTMVEAIKKNRAPNFLFLHYLRDAWKVHNLFIVPAHFFSLTVLEERKPLPPTARRAGWRGCNIILDRIPQDGRIPVIEDGRIRSMRDVRSDWRRFSFLKESTWRARGWTSDVLACVRRLGKREFTLQEMYEFEDELRELHPKNKHIRPKMRQQLQVLRDRGILRFIKRGRYMVLD